MGLTQVGSGGIKDDAITDAKLPANSVGNSEMKDDAVGVDELSASGTAGNTTYLRGDNTWTVPPDTNTTYSIQDGELSQNNFTNADHTKLDGIEASATADQTGAEIKSAYEGEADTNAYTDAEKTKLAGIAASAEVNVQSDWNASSGDAQILNKPTIPAAQVQSDWNATSGLGEVLNKPTIPSAQVSSDWNSTSSPTEILNKPTVPTVTGSTNNTITTVTGANAIQGEANLTYDGHTLSQTVDANAEGIALTAPSNHYTQLKFNANHTGATESVGYILGQWDGTDIASIALATGPDTTNKDDGQIYFYTRPSSGSMTSRMQITSTGHIGIGRTPDSTNVGSILQLEGNDGLAIRRPSQTNSTIIRPLASGDGMRINLQGGTQRLSVDADGLKFNADTAAANALDDYEEGTYTATIQAGFKGATSYTYSNGTYTKVGNLVHFDFSIQFNSATTNGNQININLPFSSEQVTATASGSGILTYTDINSASTTTAMPAIYISGGTFGSLYIYANGFTGTDNQSQNSCWLIGGGTFRAA